MKTTVRGTRIELCDNPVMMWPVVVLFTLVGAAFVALGVQEAARGASPPARAAAFGVGCIGLFMGAFAARHAERITVAIDRPGRRVFLTGWLPWRRRERSWSFDEIAGFELEEDTDDDDGRTWRAWIRLASGERVAMMANVRHHRDDVARAVELANQGLGQSFGRP